MGMEIPRHGRSWEALRDEMQGRRRRDLDYRKGRHGASVWDAGEYVADVERCLAEARTGTHPAAGRVVD